MSKWANFHSSNGVVTTNAKNISSSVTLDDSSIASVRDWQQVDWQQVFVDRKRLDLLVEDSGIMAFNLDEAGLKYVFKNCLLKQLSEDKIDYALDYLIKSFYFGSLLNPVTAAMDYLFHKDIIKPVPEMSNKQLHVLTQEQGFTVQEIYTVKQFMLSSQADDDLKQKYPEQLINPDKGKEFVLKTQATLQIEFLDQASVQIISKNMLYGNDDVKSFMTKELLEIKNLMQQKKE